MGNKNGKKGFKQRLAEKTRAFMEKHKLPKEDLTVELMKGKSSDVSRYEKGKSFMKSKIFLGFGHPKIAQPHIEASLFHELGHHASMHRGSRLGKGRKHFGRESGVLECEREAWRLADPFMTNHRSQQKWIKREAIASYQQGQKRKLRKRRMWLG